MPPKRKTADDDSDVNESSGSEFEAAELVPPKKVAKTSTTKSRLQKAKDPQSQWNNSSSLSMEKPPGEYASKCIERWHLLPPYATSITEAQWKSYYLERSALDDINTKNSPDLAKNIESEELGQDTFAILRAAASNVAATIYGATQLDEEHRTKIGRTLRGSLYFTNLWGNDEEGGSDNPRTVNAKTRLYSPLGLGTSFDLSYNFHWRQFRANEHFSNFVVRARNIADCDGKSPDKCTAVVRDTRGGEKPSDYSTQIFDMKNGKVKGTTAKKVSEFEEPLFGTHGWQSPLKMFHLLCAAGTVLHYKESNRTTVKTAGWDKFKFFAGENDGMELRNSETTLFITLEKALDKKDDKDKICMPQRLLLLARRYNQRAEEDPATSKEG